jgi:D-beta-D-heptose 7-phosphate kinase/D-beta-D-heptose 1-phosphate adenosyltransferase
MLGGVGNVVRNLVALGIKPTLLTVVGQDHAAVKVVELLEGSSGIEHHLLSQAGRVTSVKTRYVAGSQQLLRADHETVAPLKREIESELVDAIEAMIPRCDVIVLSDYAKGVISKEVASRAINLARASGKIVIVDPKGSDYSRYAGASIVKPNRRELGIAAGASVISDEDVAHAARQLIEAHNLDAVLVSLSEGGMALVENTGDAHRMRAHAREIFDVSGAGDTVVAMLAAGLGAGLSKAEAAYLSNIAAGIVVGKVGTAVVERSELIEALADASPRDAKSQTIARMIDQVQRWRLRGLKIGFTNGCFDLLHPGHISLLAQARAACDRLIVGLNSDASVARLKGPSRPLQSQISRAEVVSSLTSVDLVVIFEEDAPLHLIETIRPDVLVKGGDYDLKDVVGAEEVRAWGGKIVLANFVPGQSSTGIMKKMGGVDMPAVGEDANV